MQTMEGIVIVIVIVIVIDMQVNLWFTFFKNMVKGWEL